MNALPNNPDQSFYRRLTALETRFDTILATLATKADIAMLSAMKALIGSSRLASTAIERNGFPESPPARSPAPIQQR